MIKEPYIVARIPYTAFGKILMTAKLEQKDLAAFELRIGIYEGSKPLESEDPPKRNLYSAMIDWQDRLETLCKEIETRRHTLQVHPRDEKKISQILAETVQKISEVGATLDSLVSDDEDEAPLS